MTYDEVAHPPAPARPRPDIFENWQWITAADRPQDLTPGTDAFRERVQEERIYQILSEARLLGVNGLRRLLQFLSTYTRDREAEANNGYGFREQLTQRHLDDMLRYLTSQMETAGHGRVVNDVPGRG